MKQPISLENDFIDFLKLCNLYKVKYLVIGGYAVSIHGYPRSTKDLDVLIQMSEENAAKMKVGDPLDLATESGAIFAPPCQNR